MQPPQKILATVYTTVPVTQIAKATATIPAKARTTARIPVWYLRNVHRRKTRQLAAKLWMPRSKRSALGLPNKGMAEREGFEPSRQLPTYQISSLTPSATRPSLHTLELVLYRKDL